MVDNVSTSNWLTMFLYPTGLKCIYTVGCHGERIERKRANDNAEHVYGVNA